MELLRRPRPSSPPLRPANDSIAVAVVGCGYWGSKHVRVLSTLPEVRRVVVVDPDIGARTSIAEAYPQVTVVDSLCDALEMVEAVVVATPPSDHVATALQALRAGKHVLVEKPMATNAIDARLLVDTARRQGVALMVGHIFEFNQAVRELRRRMEDGELGEILYIHSARLNLGLYRHDVNVVWDLAPHDISIANFLLGSTPSAVRAWGSSNITRNTQDLAYFELDYGERGVTAFGHVSWLDPRKMRQVTVVGSRKMAIYDDLAEERLRIYDRGVDSTATDLSSYEMPISYRYGDIVSPHIAFDEPLRTEDDHFVRCAMKGDVPLSDGQAGLAVISVLEAIDAAMRSADRVPVVAGPSVVSPVASLATA